MLNAPANATESRIACFFDARPREFSTHSSLWISQNYPMSEDFMSPDYRHTTRLKNLLLGNYFKARLYLRLNAA